jgi:hypothetical protein
MTPVEPQGITQGEAPLDDGSFAGVVTAIEKMINAEIASLAGLHMNRLQALGHDEPVSAGDLQRIWGEVLQERTQGET